MSTNRDALTRTQHALVGTVAGGAVAIAGIGFAGSYTAVQQLAAAKGFGRFAHVFPIGLDAGIVVLLALDLLLTWLRMPYPLLRPAAWLLTAATIAFNAAAAWPDPIGVGMHAVIPVLFVIAVEAARHAIGRSAEITADRHVEPVPLRRWLLAPWPTFRLWRRMHLWQIRTLDLALALEQERLEYVDRLRARYGRGWRRTAPVSERAPLRRARFGKPIRKTITAGSVICAGPRSVLQIAIPAARSVTAQSAPALPALERRAVESATVTAPLPAPERHAPDPVRSESAEAANTPRSTPAPQSAPAAPTPDAPEHVPAPADTDQSATGKVTRKDAKAIIRRMYDDLDRRPQEPEMIAALRKAGYPHDSRAHAGKLRREIEAKEPALTERGADNVRALTGT